MSRIRIPDEWLPPRQPRRTAPKAKRRPREVFCGLNVRARRAALRARDGDRCWLCGQRIDFDAPAGSRWAPSEDHIVPRSENGPTTLDNLRLAHGACNSERGAKPLP